ncbi:MAG: MFS transporter [Bacteroidales bacterium]|nr:MFS transporter [Bacteroidales bacterium]MBR1578007.1 MFS transporter [Bacteroidales bacterium]
MKKRLLYTILSISLLTVMAGAAIAPALGVISAHFAGRNPLLIQLIVSLPALFIILTNLVFPWLCRLMKTRTLALTGLALYVLSGAGAFFVDDIRVLLVFRALMGVSVGMIMPLSTGLLAYYFPPEEQAGLMGLSAAMNQMGGVVATFLAGMLAGISWNYAFLVYLLGLIAVILVALFLPNERLSGRGGVSLSLLKRFHPSVVGMFLVMVLFFIYPTNFALTASGTLSEMGVTLTMVGLDVVAFLVGLCFGFLMKRFAAQMKYVAPLGFAAGYLCLATGSGLVWLLLGSAFIGVANGIGVPYLNTIGSVKAGKEAATTVMPLLSAALYLGQFLSPLIVSPIASATGISPYFVGLGIAVLYLLQAVLTRKKQMLPK